MKIASRPARIIARHVVAVELLAELNGRKMVIRKRGSYYAYEPASCTAEEATESLEFLPSDGIPFIGGWVVIDTVIGPPMYFKAEDFHKRWEV